MRSLNFISHENLILSDVTVAASAGNQAKRLANISLTLRPGEWLNLVGVNGSGKSTLARVLAGLYREETTGEIARGFAGEEVSPIVLQQPEAQLFGETPREEIFFALEWRGVPSVQIHKRTDWMLERFGMSVLADLPWAELSGGQKQLAAVAAAMAGESALLVLDEATSMLDEAGRSMLLQQAKNLQKSGTAIVWVTQRLDELEPDARVAALAEGALVYDGDARSFLYGAAEADSPCEQCGLRLPYLAAYAKALRAQGKLRDPLPMAGNEWRKVMAHIG